METLLDPNNALIYFDHFVYVKSELIRVTKEQYNNIVKSVKDPGIVVDANEGSKMKYYFKEIESNKVIVIGVKHENGIWKIWEYSENNSTINP